MISVLHYDHVYQPFCVFTQFLSLRMSRAGRNMQRNKQCNVVVLTVYWIIHIYL